MKIKMTVAMVAALSALALAANAQDNNPPPAGPPGADAPRPEMRQFGGPNGPRGFHLLPPRAEERLNLTDDQKKQIAVLESETQAKLHKILTPEQLEQLKTMRPPMNMHQHMRDRGGPGMRGDGQRPPMSPPPGENDGQNPPPDAPPGGPQGGQ